MCVIYILSGRVFGKNIYEIDCTSDINDRLSSEVTGFPHLNILHYSSNIEHIDIQTCQNLIIDSLYNYKMKNNNSFYKLDLNEAIEQISKIVSNITYEIQQIERKQVTKKSCFHS